MDMLIKKLSGANMDIDLASQADITWKQDQCPWNTAGGETIHRCAVKNISLCPYFCGVEYPDLLLCSYPRNNPLKP
jgi:hypothetical protein